jgi:hypothetical protein
MVAVVCRGKEVYNDNGIGFIFVFLVVFQVVKGADIMVLAP